MWTWQNYAQKDTIGQVLLLSQTLHWACPIASNTHNSQRKSLRGKTAKLRAKGAAWSLSAMCSLTLESTGYVHLFITTVARNVHIKFPNFRHFNLSNLEFEMSPLRYPIVSMFPHPIRLHILRRNCYVMETEHHAPHDSGRGLRTSFWRAHSWSDMHQIKYPTNIITKPEHTHKSHQT